MLSEIQKIVFQKRQVLKEIAEKFSNLPLNGYVKGWELSKVSVDEVFLEILEEKAEEIYNGKIAESLADQLQKKPLISTISHLGIWNHPIFVNSDLIFSLHFEKDQLVPILATESVSLNNTSSWSSSLLWHDDNLKLQRHSFLPGRLKNLPVFSTSSITKDDIHRFQAFTQGSLDDVIEILDLEKHSSANFSIQACRASFSLWQKVFPSAPKLLYLPLETIVSEYLQKILVDQENIVSKIVGTADGRQLWQKYFSNEHTFMFWGIDNKGRRQAIKNLPDNQQIAILLKSRKLYPSSPLCFLVLLQCGLACVGGFTQTTWLTEVKAKIVKLFEEMQASSEATNSIPTKNFAEGSLAWLSISSQYLTPTAVDLYKTRQDYYSKYMELANKITLGQSLRLAMPTIYNVVAPKAEHLAGFDEGKWQSEVFKDLGIDKLFQNNL